MKLLSLSGALLCLSVGDVNGFGIFGFGGEEAKGSPAKIPEITTRGISPHQLDAYKGDTFECDGSRVAKGLLNDGYCDCADGKDEPGTSACSSNEIQSVFHCVNDGYKVIVLPSSRVDDGICDCCDGSDEGLLTTCLNTCAAAAKAEYAELEGMRVGYRVGNAKRLEYVQSIKDKYVADIQRAKDLEPELVAATEESEVLRDAVRVKEATLQQLKDKAMADQRAESKELVFANVGLARFSAAFVPELTLSFLQLADPSISDILDALDPEGLFVRSGAEEGEEEGEREEDDEPDHELSDHDGPMAHVSRDEERRGLRGSDSGHDGCVLSPLLTEAGSDFTDSIEEICSHLMDNATGSGGGEEAERARQVEQLLWFLVELASRLDKNAGAGAGADTNTMHIGGAASQLHALAAHPSGPSSPQAKAAANPGRGICPSHLLSAECVKHGALGRLLEQSRSPIVAANVVSDVASALEGLRSELRDREKREKELKEEKSRTEGLQTLYTQYENHLQWLHLKDTCVKTRGGEFTYDMCVSATIHQSDRGGHNVMLGKYNTISEQDDGTFVMKFTGGQHCHAFGARSADVFITCGAENVLSDVQEPSTCYYTFHMTSPGACTPKYGAVHNLQA